MEPLSWSHNSWHCWLVKNLTSKRYFKGEKIDGCEYIRTVFGALLMLVSIVALLLVLLVMTVLTSIVLIGHLFGFSTYNPGPVALTVGGAVLFTLGLQLMTFVGKKGVEWFRSYLNRRFPPHYKPIKTNSGFLKTVWVSFRDKVCFVIELK